MHYGLPAEFVAEVRDLRRRFSRSLDQAKNQEPSAPPTVSTVPSSLAPSEILEAISSSCPLDLSLVAHALRLEDRSCKISLFSNDEKFPHACAKCIYTLNTVPVHIKSPLAAHGLNTSTTIDMAFELSEDASRAAPTAESTCRIFQHRSIHRLCAA